MQLDATRADLYVATSQRRHKVIGHIRREIEKIRLRFRRGQRDFPGHSKHMRRRLPRIVAPQSLAIPKPNADRLVKGLEAVCVHSRHWPFHTLPEWSALIYCALPKTALLACDCKHFATVDASVQLCGQRTVEGFEISVLSERAFPTIRQQHRHTEIVACHCELGFQLKRALE